MLKTMTFFVDHRPIAKQSFRMGKFGGYQPKRVTDFKKHAQLVARHAAKKHGWAKDDGPLMITFVFQFRCPKSASKADKLLVRWNTKRPDLDNIEKSITDALDDLMSDDSQVCYKISKKIIAKHGDVEGITVTISQLPKYPEQIEEESNEPV